MVSDEVLIRLLEIARDIDNGVEVVEEMTGVLAPMTEAEGRAMVDHTCVFGRMPELTGLPAHTDRLRGQSYAIASVVLDLLGVPSDNTVEYDRLGLLPVTDVEEWPKGCFCRDWCMSQIWTAQETGRFKAAIGRIRRAVAAGFED